MKALESVERQSVERQQRGAFLTLSRSHVPALSPSRALTLIEVMMALGIFFMAVFTILALVSNILRNARGLQRPQVDAGLAAAIYANTNRYSIGTVAGELDDSLPDFSYEIATDEFATNGLLQADIILNRRSSHQAPDGISILVFDPYHQSAPFPGRR